MTLKSILELSAKATLSDYVTVIAWSPIGNTLAAASGAGEVYLLNKGVGASLCEPTGQSIDALAFSFDGKWLATGGQAGTITLWQMDGDAPKIADTLECGSWVDRLVWHPTCNHLAFNQGKTVQIWDANQAETGVWSKLVGERVVFKPNRNMVVFVVLKKAYLLNISLGLILNQHE